MIKHAAKNVQYSQRVVAALKFKLHGRFDFMIFLTSDYFLTEWTIRNSSENVT